MNFQRHDLAGAIRTKSFFKPVPVNMGFGWRKYRRAILWLLFSAVCLLISILSHGH